MTCSNKVEFFVPRGFSHRQVFVPCGNTDPWGGRTICHDCASDRAEMARIERHEANVKADNEAARSAGWGEFQPRLGINLAWAAPQKKDQ